VLRSHGKSIFSVSIMGILFGAGICLGVVNPYHLSNATDVLAMRDCMKCHDKNTKRPVTICLGDNCLYSGDHSLKHRYPPIGKEKDYAPVSEIEKAGCFLENGTITCLSCHDLTKPPPHLIKDGDQLCLICHTNLFSN
jgi:hypothetical protein